MAVKSAPQIALIVGNGMTIDFNKFFNIAFDCSSPLKIMDSPNTFIAHRYLQPLPNLREALDRIRKDRPNATDYDIIRVIVDEAVDIPIPATEEDRKHLTKTQILEIEQFRGRHGKEAAIKVLRRWFPGNMVRSQLVKYLVYIFSNYQFQADKVNIGEWPWTRWLARHAHCITGVVSFNYDLIVDNALQHSSSFPILYLANKERMNDGGLALFKIHGSLNFDMHPELLHISMPDVSESDVRHESIFTQLMNVPIRIIKDSELHLPRLGQDIVLPGEASKIRYFQYISPGFDYFHVRGKDITHLIIAGLSYWDCDRKEIDELLRSISPRAKVIIVNPKPSKELYKKVSRRFDSCILKACGPPDYLT